MKLEAIKAAGEGKKKNKKRLEETRWIGREMSKQ
jgi:hypothetical protein